MTDGQSSHTGDAGTRSVAASERLLAWLLAGFLLLGLAWGYTQIGESVNDRRGPEESRRSAAVSELQDSLSVKRRSLGLEGRFASWSVEADGRRLERRQKSLTFARERYRTALEANSPSATALARTYRTADARATEAAKQLRASRRGRATAVRLMRETEQRLDPRLRAANRRLAAFEEGTRNRIFAWRTAFVLGALALALLLLRVATSRWPRSVPLTQAAVGAAALIVLTLVVDYSAVNLDFYTAGPLGLAAIGAALTIAAFVALQRYLSRSRPARRIRHGECASCGQPSTTPFCEGCGQPVIALCGTCQEPRRLGTAHCGACGAS